MGRGKVKANAVWGKMMESMENISVFSFLLLNL